MGRDQPNERHRVFDLLKNPFSILRIDPTSTFEKISEAYDDAVADQIAPPGELLAAKEALINPKQRIISELSFLIDTPSTEAISLLDALRRGSLSRNQLLIARLAPLSRANILAHLGADSPADGDLLYNWIDAQANVNPDALLAKIRLVRKVASITVTPSIDVVRETLHDLSSLQRRAVLSGYEAPQDGAKYMQDCTKRILVSPDADRLEALSGLVSTYAQTIIAQRATLESQAKRAVEKFQDHPTDSASLTSLAKILRVWTFLSGPVIELEAHKGRDEEASRKLYYELRNASIFLANEKEKFKAALSLTELASEAFASLPYVGKQLKDDRSTLEGRNAESRVTPLKKWIDSQDAKFASLISDLEKRPFDANASRKAKELWELFTASVQQSLNTAASDLPWILVRGVAIDINNNDNAPTAARVLVQGMLSYANEQQPSKEVADQLQTDFDAIERVIREKSLMESIQGNRYSEALETLNKLLSARLTNEDRELFTKLKTRLEGERTSRNVKWGIYALIALGIIVYAIASDQTKKTSSYSPPSGSYSTPAPSSRPATSSPTQSPPNQIPAPAPQQIPLEQMPAVGGDLTFSEANLRYCLFQSARIEAIRNERLTNNEVALFNVLIEDWNSRCAKYRYRESERNRVSAEAATNASRLAAQWRAILARWRGANQ